MEFIRSLIIFVYVLETWTTNAQHHHKDGERFSCEPDKIKYRMVYWKNRYKMQRDKSGFLYKDIHKSTYTFGKPNESNGVKRYMHLALAYETENVVTFAQLRPHVNALINFYRGDNMIIHKIEAATGKYTRVEIGIHTKVFTLPLKASDWFAVELQKHMSEKFVLLGLTLLQNVKDNTNLYHEKRDKLVSMFPQHEDIIREYTDYYVEVKKK